MQPQPISLESRYRKKTKDFCVVYDAASAHQSQMITTGSQSIGDMCMLMAYTSCLDFSPTRAHDLSRPRRFDSLANLDVFLASPGTTISETARVDPYRRGYERAFISPNAACSSRSLLVLWSIVCHTLATTGL